MTVSISAKRKPPVCSTVEALIAAGPSLDTLKGVVIEEHDGMENLRTMWRATRSLPGAKECYVVKALTATGPSYVCTIVEGKGDDVAKRLYTQLVGSVEQCDRPSAWVMHHLTAPELAVGFRIDARTTWRPAGADDAFGIEVTLRHSTRSVSALSLELGNVLAAAPPQPDSKPAVIVDSSPSGPEPAPPPAAPPPAAPPAPAPAPSAPRPKSVDLKPIAEATVKKLTGRGGKLEGGFQAPFWGTHRDKHWTDTPTLNANGQYYFLVLVDRAAIDPHVTLLLNGKTMEMERTVDQAAAALGIYTIQGAATLGNSGRGVTVEYNAGSAADSLLIAIQYF